MKFETMKIQMEERQSEPRAKTASRGKRLLQVAAVVLPVVLVLVLLTIPTSQARLRNPLIRPWGAGKLQFLAKGSSSQAVSFTLRMNELPCVVEAVTTSGSSYAAQTKQLTHLRARAWEDITEEMALKMSEMMEEEGIVQQPVPQVDIFEILQTVRLLRKGETFGFLTAADTPEGAQVGFACVDATPDEILDAFTRPSDPRAVPGIPLPRSTQPHVHIEGIGGMENHAVFLETNMPPDSACQWQKNRMSHLGWKALAFPPLGGSLPRLLLFRRGGQGCLFAACRLEGSGNSLVMIFTGV